MRNWGYGLNGYDRECFVHLEEGPWWAFALIAATDWLCDHAPEWKVPFINRIRIVRDDEPTTVGEEYGDTTDTWFCCFIHHPVSNWAIQHIHAIEVPLAWEEGKRLFYEGDPEWWDEEEAEGGAMRKEKETTP